MHLDYTKDVMDLMTEFRGTWGMKYPEEEYRKMTEEIFEDLSKVVTYF